MIDDFSFAIGVIWGTLVIIVGNWLYYFLKEDSIEKKESRPLNPDLDLIMYPEKEPRRKN